MQRNVLLYLSISRCVLGNVGRGNADGAEGNVRESHPRCGQTVCRSALHDQCAQRRRNGAGADCAEGQLGGFGVQFQGAANAARR